MKAPNLPKIQNPKSALAAATLASATGLTGYGLSKIPQNPGTVTERIIEKTPITINNILGGEGYIQQDQKEKTEEDTDLKKLTKQDFKELTVWAYDVSKQLEGAMQRDDFNQYLEIWKNNAEGFQKAGQAVVEDLRKDIESLKKQALDSAKFKELEEKIAKAQESISKLPKSLTMEEIKGGIGFNALFAQFASARTDIQELKEMRDRFPELMRKIEKNSNDIRELTREVELEKGKRKIEEGEINKRHRKLKGEFDSYKEETEQTLTQMDMSVMENLEWFDKKLNAVIWENHLLKLWVMRNGGSGDFESLKAELEEHINDSNRTHTNNKKELEQQIQNLRISHEKDKADQEGKIEALTNNQGNIREGSIKNTLELQQLRESLKQTDQRVNGNTVSITNLGNRVGELGRTKLDIVTWQTTPSFPDVNWKERSSEELRGFVDGRQVG